MVEKLFIDSRTFIAAIFFICVLAFFLFCSFVWTLEPRIHSPHKNWHSSCNICSLGRGEWNLREIADTFVIIFWQHNHPCIKTIYKKMCYEWVTTVFFVLLIFQWAQWLIKLATGYRWVSIHSLIWVFKHFNAISHNITIIIHLSLKSPKGKKNAFKIIRATFIKKRSNEPYVSLLRICKINIKE